MGRNTAEQKVQGPETVLIIGWFYSFYFFVAYLQDKHLEKKEMGICVL